MYIDSVQVNVRILDSSIVGDQFLCPEYFYGKLSSFFLRAYIKNTVCLVSNKTMLISTGISVNIFDKEARVIIKPIIKIKKEYDIIIGNIFSFFNFSYSGELKISLWNFSKKDFFINPDDKIAQLFIHSKKNIKLIYI